MTKALPALLVVMLATGGGIWAYGRYEQEIGRRDATIRTQDSTLAVLRKSVHRVDSLYVVQVDTLWRRKAVYDTIRDTLLKHLTDTLKVVEYIHAADSTIQACSQVVLTCQLKVSQRDSIILQQTAQLRLLRTPPRLFGLIPAPSRSLVFGIGLVGGYLLHR